MPRQSTRLAKKKKQSSEESTSASNKSKVAPKKSTTTTTTTTTKAPTKKKTPVKKTVAKRKTTTAKKTKTTAKPGPKKAIQKKKPVKEATANKKVVVPRRRSTRERKPSVRQRDPSPAKTVATKAKATATKRARASKRAPKKQTTSKVKAKPNTKTQTKKPKKKNNQDEDKEEEEEEADDDNDDEAYGESESSDDNDDESEFSAGDEGGANTTSSGKRKHSESGAPTAEGIQRIKQKNANRKDSPSTNDVRGGLPKGLMHFRGLNLGNTASSLGIPYKKALIGFNKVRGFYYPSFSGIVMFRKDADDLRYGLKWKSVKHSIQQQNKRQRMEAEQNFVNGIKTKYKAAREQALLKVFGKNVNLDAVERGLHNRWSNNNDDSNIDVDDPKNVLALLPRSTRQFVSEYRQGRHDLGYIEYQEIKSMTISELKMRAADADVDVRRLKTKIDLQKALVEAAADAADHASEVEHLRNCTQRIEQRRKMVKEMLERRGMSEPELFERVWEGSRSYYRSNDGLAEFDLRADDATTFRDAALTAVRQVERNERENRYDRKRNNVSLSEQNVWQRSESFNDRHILRELTNSVEENDETKTKKKSLVSVDDAVEEAFERLKSEVAEWRAQQVNLRQQAKNTCEIVNKALKRCKMAPFDPVQHSPHRYYQWHELSLDNGRWPLPYQFVQLIQRCLQGEIDVDATTQRIYAARIRVSVLLERVEIAGYKWDDSNTHRSFNEHNNAVADFLFDAPPPDRSDVFASLPLLPRQHLCRQFGYRTGRSLAQASYAMALTLAMNEIIDGKRSWSR